ncbi:MAG: toprim domain-containing protein [Deltaproteobacteria bacterium]|nr:toprim domain-containing protein [Deltaproteobacteria bacterium]
MKSKTEWVDFKEIKEKVKIEDILQHYNLLEGFTRKDDELTGFCPIHDSERYYKDSFSANVKKNNWHCFVCDAGGNILDFVAQIEDVSIREAALLIQEWFDITPKKPELARRKGGDRTKAKREAAAPTPAAPSPSIEPVNPPLTFKLKNLDSNHPYLKERGLAKETIKAFGLGFCQRGLIKERIAIPIHNENGELVAYAGRYPGEPPEGEPKYKLPPKFQKHLVLYNFHQAKDLAKEQSLILVEGFFDLFNIWQAGLKNVVALMGTSMSDEQARLIVEELGPDGKLALMLDPDEVGLKATQEIIDKLIEKLYIKVINLKKEGLQPDSLSKENIQELLSK